MSRSISYSAQSGRVDAKKLRIFVEMVALFAILQLSGFLKYLLLLAYVLVYALLNRVVLKARYWVLSLPMVFCCLLGAILGALNGSDWTYFCREFCFLLIPVFCACLFVNSVRGKGLHRYIAPMFYAISFLFLTANITHIFSLGESESTHAFVFGAFCVYFFYKKEMGKSVLSALLCLLAFKRIALLGLAAAFAFLLLMRLLNPKHRKGLSLKFQVSFFGLLVSAALLFYAWMVRSGAIYDIFSRYGVNSMGRSSTWSYFAQYYDFSLFFCGKGLGSVQTILDQYGSVNFTRLHNDVLTFYINLGFLGSFLYFYLHFLVFLPFSRLKAFSKKAVFTAMALMVYLFVCYLTDNISIYVVFMFPFYLMVSDILHNGTAAPWPLSLFKRRRKI